MYGKLNQRKIHQNDYIMSCQKVRQQLATYMNQQAKRVNVDSAKKRAVVQHMDYQGFRQMVLGANIFPTKSKQLYTFTKGQNIPVLPIKHQQQPQSQTATKPQKQPILTLTQKQKQQQALLQKIQGKSQMHCNSFRQFKKKFNANYDKQIQQKYDQSKTQYCYNLLKQQNQERIRKIFNTQCQGNILLKIVTIFDRVITSMTRTKAGLKDKQDNMGMNVQRQAQFMLIFFKTLLSISTMKSITLAILSKKQKQSIADFIIRLKDVLKQEEDVVQAEKISAMIEK